MENTNQRFYDLHHFDKMVEDWNLDFRLLSRNDFSAHLSRISGKNFSIAKIRMNGKIEQKGRSPSQFLSIAIPCPTNKGFLWLNKRVIQDKLLVFPEDGLIDAVSYNDFSVYVFSIDKEKLKQLFQDQQYERSKRILSGTRRILDIDSAFVLQFSRQLEELLNSDQFNEVQRENFGMEVLFTLLNYIENLQLNRTNSRDKRSAIGVRKAVELINDEANKLLTIPDLCEVSGLSERSLQYAFKEKFHVNPLEYLKSVRLHRVYRELYDERSNHPIISSIAREHHFWHMGEFAKDFYKKFGVLPSEIIRK